MVQSLYEIALWKCIQLSARITDVGDIPYPLVRPVLKRLNAKQLMVVEQNSPALMPESDELWSALIERDFPDRPSKAKKALVGADDGDMPNRLLYERYIDEREELRASSAQRLRKMTQKLQKEKSRNSIVPIQGIMREPVTRRRMASMSLAPPPYSKYGSKSILGKAMKDVQHRHLMFKGSSRSDPFAAFGGRKRENSVKMPSQPRMPPLRVPENGPMGIYSQRPLRKPDKSPIVSPSKQNASMQRSGNERTSGVSSPQRPSSPQESPNLESRKRKAASVFLSSKRLPKAPRIPSDRAKRTETRVKTMENPGAEKPVEKPGVSKAVRSLIFY